MPLKIRRTKRLENDVVIEESVIIESWSLDLNGNESYKDSYYFPKKQFDELKAMIIKGEI